MPFYCCFLQNIMYDVLKKTVDFKVNFYYLSYLLVCNAHFFPKMLDIKVGGAHYAENISNCGMTLNMLSLSH